MKLLVIDGNSIANRAFYGIRPLSNSNGVFTHAIYGFMNIYLKNLAEVQPDGVVVAFDLKAPTFRHKANADYKANRHGMPEELAMQMPLIKKLLQYLGVSVVTCEGYEADDIMGTLAKASDLQGAECVVLSGDRDNLQLATNAVTVRLVTNKETIPYTPERFQEEYGFAPLSLIDCKALMGDSSDNIKGVAGIGEKTAKKLIAQWGTIENLYENLADCGGTKSVIAKLEAGQEDAKTSKWLATIVTDAPVDTEIEHYRFQPVQKQELRQFLLELELKKLLDRLLPTEETSESAEQTTPSAVSVSVEELPLSQEQLDHLTDPVCLWQDGVLQVQFAEELDHIYLTQEQFLIEKLWSKPYLTFGAKPQYRQMLFWNQTLNAEQPLAQDAEIAAYLLNPTTSSYEIEKLCITYHIPCVSGPYGALLSLRKLYAAMMEQIEEQNMTFLYKMECQLTVVLADMEQDGILVDAQGVKNFGVMLDDKIREMEQLIYDAAGKEFKIGSPKQLGVVLFEDLELPHGKKNKTGYSTNVDVLEKLRDSYPIADWVLKWRQYSKLKSTYVDGLLKTIESDGRIHTVFRQTETRTGRISSTEPNLQNIPVRTELGKNMRKFFIAKENCVYLDADYSQIELRLMANLSGDEAMQQAFLEGADIHTATAAQVFEMPIELVTSEMRSAAKAVNFGILYGMGAFSLSQDIHVSVKQANQYIQNYMARFPKVGEFMEQTVNDAKITGYVSTYFNRRRPVPELLATNKMVQAAGKRVAMNTPIQGTAADLIKIAMVNVYIRLKKEVPEAKLILQVHDELIVEVPAQYQLLASIVLQEEMELAVKNTVSEEAYKTFPVPFLVEVGTGESWYEAKG